METLSPYEERLHRTLLRELMKDDLGNKVVPSGDFRLDRSSCRSIQVATSR